MSIFKIINGKLDIETQNLTIPEFKIIYERDTSDSKELAFRELAYVYHMSDYTSPYANTVEEDRQTALKKDYGIEHIDQIINEAISKYKLLSETQSMRTLNAAEKAMRKIEKYYEEVDLQERDNHGKVVNKATDLSSSMGNLGKMIESIAKLKDQVKKEQATGSKIRGDKKIGMFE